MRTTGMESMQSMAYGTVGDVTAAELGAVLPAYASVAALLAALNAAAVVACLVGGEGAAQESIVHRAIRADLSVAINGAEDTTIRENWYLVSGLSLDEKAGIRTELIAAPVWTAGATAIPTALGGRSATHRWPKAVTLNATGVLLARTGSEVAAVSQLPAIATALDLGSARGILRVMALGAATPATGGVPMHARWR